MRVVVLPKKQVGHMNMLAWTKIACTAAIALLGLPGAAVAQSGGLMTGISELQNPPEMTNVNGTFQLTASFGTYGIVNGPAQVQTRSFTQAGSDLLVGPTLRVKPGDTLNLTFTNNLNYSAADGDAMMSDFLPHGFNVMNIHYHGLHVTPQSPGDNVLLNIFPTDTTVPEEDLCKMETAGDVAHKHVCITDSYDYSFQIPANHPAGSFWYHPHKHGAVAIHLASGMAGLLIIEDPVNGLESLPAVQTATEKQIVLQEPVYRTNVAQGQPFPIDCLANYSGDSSCQYDPLQPVSSNPPTIPVNSKFTVNGQFNANITMKVGEAQLWRVVNTTVGNTLPMCLVPMPGTQAAAPTMYVLTADGIPLQRTVSGSQELPFALSPPVSDLSGPNAAVNAVNNELVLLTAGQRLDLMVKAPSQPGVYALLQRPGPTAMDGLCTPPTAAEVQSAGWSDKLVMHVTVVEIASQIAYNQAVPTQAQLNGLQVPVGLTTASDVPSTPTQTVVFGFSPSPMPPQYAVAGGASLINGNVFSTTAVQRTLTLNKMDMWATSSQTDTHMFHIHINPFQVTQRGGQAYAFPVWRDTLLINCNTSSDHIGWCSFRGGLTKQTLAAQQPEVVQHLSRAVDFTGAMVLHCHNVWHEDNGMMQLVEIVDERVAIEAE